MKRPLHQETATSSRNGHIIKKRRFLMKLPFFDEFRFTGTFFTSYHVELDEVPRF